MAATLCAWVLAATPSAAERLNVPLSDPAKPAELEVSLVMGSIKVTGGPVREVVIEALSRAEDEDEDDDRDLPGDRVGMRRIPNTSIGLEAEEEGNKVSISAESWARAVDLEIQVPAGSTVRLSTVNDGDIEVENIDGEVEVSNTNGEIRVKNVRGPVSANDGERRRAGRLPGRHGGGADGLLDPERRCRHHLSGRSQSRRPAELGQRRDLLRLRRRRHDGERCPGWTRSRSRARSALVIEREMRGKVNGGGPEILFKTFNGDILLRRAKN